MKRLHVGNTFVLPFISYCFISRGTLIIELYKQDIPTSLLVPFQKYFRDFWTDTHDNLPTQIFIIEKHIIENLQLHVIVDGEEVTTITSSITE